MAQPTPEAPTQPAPSLPPPSVPRSKAARWLEQHAGYVLIVIGVTMLIGAALLADKPAVAPIFAAFGAGLVVLGCFSSRIEGNLEATRDGVKAVVRAVEMVAIEEDLSPHEFADVLSMALDRFDAPSRRRPEIVSAAKQAAADAADEVQHAPVLREARLSHTVAAALRARGYDVEEQVRAGDHRLDIVASHGREILLVEVYGHHSSVRAAEIRRIAGLRQHFERGSEPGESHVRAAVAVMSNSRGFTPDALTTARELGIELLVVNMFGDLIDAA